MAQDPRPPGEITDLLARWSDGDRFALADLTAMAYDHLRKIAKGFLRRESPAHTLQATALVNELYLRLIRQQQVRVVDRAHFYALSAVLMRRILVDYARHSNADKRSAGERVPLDEGLAWIDASSDDMVSLNHALGELEAIDERAARIIDLRFFLGCTDTEIAGILDLSRSTVDRDLEFAKAWLYRRLTKPAAQTAQVG